MTAEVVEVEVDDVLILVEVEVLEVENDVELVDTEVEEVEVELLDVELEVEEVDVLEVLVLEVDVEVVEVEVLEVEVEVVPVSKSSNSPMASLYTLPTTPAEAFNKDPCWIALMVSSIPLERSNISPEPSLYAQMPVSCNHATQESTFLILSCETQPIVSETAIRLAPSHL